MKPRVLIAAPDDKATSLYISNAFVENGWQPEIYDYRLIAQQQGFEMMNELFWNAARERDLVLVLKGEILRPETLRTVAGKVPTALWHFDSWQAKEPFIIERAKTVKFFFTIARGLVPWYQSQGINAHWLTEACSPPHHCFYYDQPTTHYGGRRYRSEVTFIGTVAGVGDRADWLVTVKKRFPGLMVWGSFSDPRVKEFHLGRVETDRDHAELCYRSKVNLDRSRTADIEGSWSARIYRIMAAGGFLLANNVKGIRDYFSIPREFDVYDPRDYDNCLEKIFYYLSNPEERQEIAEHGRFRVVNVETFSQRIRELLKVMGL